MEATAQELARALEILKHAAIEVAEAGASEKQLEFQRYFFDRSDGTRKLDTFVAMGGNRSGKSYVCGWLCFAKYLRDRARDGDWFWCVGQNLDRSVGGQQRELWNALPRHLLGEQQWGEKIGFGLHRKITVKTSDGGQCLVEFRSADQEPSTFEQAKLVGVWCDERLPETIYNRLLPRLVDRDGWILYSDIPEQWWQFERLKEAKPSAGVHFQHFTMYDNEHNLPTGAIEKVAGQMTDDEKKLRIGGDFVVMEGVVYKEFADHIHAIDPFPVPESWPRWRIIDYGGSSPTACLWATISPNEKAFIYREHYEAGKSIQWNAAKIVEASASEKYRQNFIDPHAFDKSPANERTIAEQYGSAGIACSPWPYVNVMGEHAMVQRVKYRLERQTLFVFKNCVNTRREFQSWKYKLDKDGKPMASDAFENGNNHALDCVKGWINTHPAHCSGGLTVIAGR